MADRLTAEGIALIRHVGVAWCTEEQFAALLAAAERESRYRVSLRSIAARCTTPPRTLSMIGIENVFRLVREEARAALQAEQKEKTT